MLILNIKTLSHAHHRITSAIILKDRSMMSQFQNWLTYDSGSAVI